VRLVVLLLFQLRGIVLASAHCRITHSPVKPHLVESIAMPPYNVS
jgi:hypothetical protein